MAKYNIKRFSSQEQNDIANKYKQGIGSQRLSQEYGCSRKTIIKVVKNFGIKIRTTKDYFKYDPNLNYFEVIDTKNKAYFLGLMFADGWVRHKNGMYVMGIQLVKEDSYLLDCFNKELYDKERKIILRRRGEENDGCKRKDNRMFYFHGEKLFNDLVSHGCVENKSLILEPPVNIPDELIRYFILGFFDGDGGATKNARVVSFTSTLNFCNWIGGILIKNKIIKKYSLHKCYNGTTYCLSICSKQNIKNIYYYFYHDNPLCLKRKKEAIFSMF